MTIGKITAADDHLSRMVGAKPELGLAELVWNAVDANATAVEVTAASEGGESTRPASQPGRG